jgi:hypothetical protein
MIWGWCLVFLIAGQQPIVSSTIRPKLIATRRGSRSRRCMKMRIAVLVRADPQAGQGPEGKIQEAAAGAKRQAAMRVAASPL